MKIQKHKFVIITILVLSATILILFAQRQKGYEYRQILEKSTYQFDYMSVGDKIVGFYNGLDIYSDYYVSDYQSLDERSDIIALIIVNKCEQLGNAVYATAVVEQRIKGDIDDNAIIKIIMPNYIRYNTSDVSHYYLDTDKAIHMILISPCVNMAEGKEYIVFLQKMDDYKYTYRLSTLLYSVVPVKESIKIMVIDNEKMSQYDGTIDCNSDYDYIAVSMQHIHEEQIIDEKYLSRIPQAQMLASDYSIRYQSICERAYQLVNKYADLVICEE